MTERRDSGERGADAAEAEDGAAVHMWLAGPLPAGVESVLARLRRTAGVAQIAVMPDVHLAAEFCVGTVVATERLLFPNAVGGDIGCGMLAMPFDAEADMLADGEMAARVLGNLAEACPARRHHRRTAHALPAELGEQPLSDPRLEEHMRGEECRTQLGTLGAGNHFLELQRDEADGRLWLMIHTGSRHLGQCIHHHFVPKGRRLATGILALEADSAEGRAYYGDVQIARAWARENRLRLALRTGELLERLLHVTPLVGELYDCDHNHLAMERHGGGAVFVHRKGASAAGVGMRGIIPGSMGTHSFHTIGRGEARALHSSSHGAGRALSRAQARERITVSAVRQQLRGVWYDVRLERQLREEAPGAYKQIDAVMRAQEGLASVVRRLRPVLVYKGV